MKLMDDDDHDDDPHDDDDGDKNRSHVQTHLFLYK